MLLLLLLLMPAATSAGLCTYGQTLLNGECTSCPPGEYQDQTDGSACQSCPENTFSAAAESAYCRPCLPETFAATGQSVCTPCEGQTTGTCCDGFAGSPCTACAAGTYVDDGTCQDCPVGEVSTRASTTCTPCDGQTIPFTAPGISVCVACAAGFEKANATHCRACAPGAFSDSDSVCQTCPVGFASFESTQGCEECQAGTYSTGGQTNCTVCADGLKSPPRASECLSECPDWANGTLGQACLLCDTGRVGPACTDCPAGRFKDISIGPDCDECPSGFITVENAFCVACAAGQYAFENECRLCPNGFAQPVDAQSACVVPTCPTGTHRQAEGLTQCAPCAPGKFQDAFDSAEDCKLCAAGTYSLIGSYQCVECSIGFGSNGSAPCAACAPGRGTVSGQCVDCPSGHVSDGSVACTACPRGRVAQDNICVDCPLGRYQSEAGQMDCDVCLKQTNIVGTGSWDCVDCTSSTCDITCGAGYYRSGTECRGCPTGFSSSGGQLEACTECSVGFFASALAGVCQMCPAGQYQPTSGRSSCTNCPVGYSSSSGQSECTACSQGTVQPVEGQSECDTCPAGKTTAGTGNSICSVTCDPQTPNVVNGVCVDCPMGVIYQDGVCVPCAPGQTTRDNVCEDCVPGRYASGGVCKNCAAGRFTQDYAQISCKACASATSSVQCDGCAAGLFQSPGGDCQTCPAGYWSSARSERCAACIMGKYQSASGSSTCRSCAQGSFQPLDAAMSCRYCPAGYFQGELSQGACHACPKSHYAAGSGNVECTACPVGKANVQGALTSLNDCQACPAGSYESDGVCVSCAEGYFQGQTGQVECQPCPPGFIGPAGSTSEDACFNVAGMTSYVFGMVGDAKPAQKKTLTCEIRPNFVLLCPGCTCDDDSRNGFWSGPVCDECRRGFATKTCTTICPGYDGSDDHTMCSGNGKCWFGKNGNGLCYCGSKSELDKTADNTVVDVQLCPKGKICTGYGPSPQPETTYKPMYYIFKYRQFSVFVLQISTHTPARGHMWFQRFPPELVHENLCAHCVSRYDPKNAERTVVGAFYEQGGGYHEFSPAQQSPNGFHGENCQYECAACLHSGYCANVPHPYRYVYEIQDTFLPQVPVYIPQTTCICPSIIYDSNHMCCPNGFQPYVYYGHKDSTPYSRFSKMPYITSLSNTRKEFWINKDLWLEPEYGFPPYVIPGSAAQPGRLYVSNVDQVDQVDYLSAGPYNKHVYHGVPRDICRACPGLFGKGVRLQSQRIESEQTAERSWWDNSMGASARKCNGVGVCDFYDQPAEPTVHFMGDADKYMMVHRGRYCIREDPQDIASTVTVAPGGPHTRASCVAYAKQHGAQFIAIQEEYLGGSPDIVGNQSYASRSEAIDAARQAFQTGIAKFENETSVNYYVVKGALPRPDSNAPYTIIPILTQDTCSIFYHCRRTTMNPRFNVYKMEKGRGLDRLDTATFNRFDTCFTYSFESDVQTLGLYQTTDYVQGDDPFLGGLCPLGHYCSMYDNIGYKEACPAGYYQPFEAMTRTQTAVRCATATYPQGDCIPNAATAAFDDFVDPVCIRCPRNEYALPGSEVCTECPLGRVKKFSGEWDTSTKMLNMETWSEPGYDPWYYTPDETGIMEHDCAQVPAGIVHLTELNDVFNTDDYTRNPRFLPVLSCPYGYSSYPGSRAAGNVDDIVSSITTYRAAIIPPFVEFGLTYTFETITSGTCADRGWFEIDDRAVCANAALQTGVTSSFTQPSRRTGYMGCYKHNMWGDKNIVQFSDGTYVSDEVCQARPYTTTICQNGERREGMMAKFARAYCYRCPGDAITGPRSMTCTSCHQSKSKVYSKGAVQTFAERSFLQDVVVQQGGSTVAAGISYLANAFANVHLIQLVSASDVAQKCTNAVTTVKARFANDPQVFALSDCVLACSMRGEFEFIGHSAKQCLCAETCTTADDSNPALTDPVWYKNVYALERTEIEVQVEQAGKTSNKVFTMSEFDATDWSVLNTGCPSRDIVAIRTGPNFDQTSCAFVCTRLKRPFFMTFSGNECQCGVELLTDGTSCTTYANDVYTKNGVADLSIDIQAVPEPDLGWSTAMPLCANCQPGFWRDPNAVDNLCTKCEAGYYTSTDIAANSFEPCAACGRGTYQDARGASECTSCAPGLYMFDIGQTACTECPVGYHQTGAGATACQQCQGGRFADEVGQINCKGCPPGTVSQGGTTGATTAAAACQDCTAGQYQDAYGGQTCYACAPGRHAPQSGQDQCAACQAGKYTPNSGQTTCSACAAGFFSETVGRTDACDACPSGTYTDTTGQTECTQCPRGRTCDSMGPGSACTPGTFKPAGQYGSCQLCSTGQFSGGSVLLCETCPLGQYQDQMGQSTCKDCTPRGWSNGDQSLDVVSTGSRSTFLQTSNGQSVVFELTPLQVGTAVLRVGAESVTVTSVTERLSVILNTLTSIRLDVISGEYRYREYVVTGQTEESQVYFNGDTYDTQMVLKDTYAPFTEGTYFQTAPNVQC